MNYVEIGDNNNWFDTTFVTIYWADFDTVFSH